MSVVLSPGFRRGLEDLEIVDSSSVDGRGHRPPDDTKSAGIRTSRIVRIPPKPDTTPTVKVAQANLSALATSGSIPLIVPTGLSVGGWDVWTSCWFAPTDLAYSPAGIVAAPAGGYLSVQRSWSWVYQQGTLTPIWYQDPSGITPGQPCTTAPPASCGSPHTDTASFSANPSNNSPFTLSGTPAAAAGNYTSDPVGGTVAISA
jgi:hypothetical protein